MGTSLIDNFNYRGRRFLDSRQSVATLSDLRAVAESAVPDGFRAYCAETALWYEYNSANPTDPSTGRWRAIPTADSVTEEIKRTITPEITDEENTVPSNKAVKVGMDAISEAVNEVSDNLEREFKVNLIYGHYISPSGRIGTFNTKSIWNCAGYSLFKLIGNCTVRFYGMYSNVDTENKIKAIGFFNKDREFISAIHKELADGEDIVLNDLISEAPENSEYFSINFLPINPRFVCSSTNYIINPADNGYSPELLLKFNIDNIIQSLEGKCTPFLGNNLNLKEEVGYLNKFGRLINDVNYHCLISEVFACRPGDKFLYKGWGEGSAYSIIFFSDITYANKLETDISLINNPSGNDSIQISSKDEFVEATVPDGAYFVKFTSFNSVNKEITLEVTPVVSIKNTLEPEIIDKDALLKGNNLYKKKWYCCGDSFSEGDYTGAPNAEATLFSDGIYKGLKKVYSRFIAERNDIDLKLLAKCGATVGAWKDDDVDNPTNKNNFYKMQLPLIEEDSSFTGYITLWFGINDSARCYLGTIDDTGLTTFYGALNWSASTLISKFPLAHIGFVVSNRCETDFQQAVRDVATKYGIPYLDMVSDVKIPTVGGDRKNQTPAIASQLYQRWSNIFCVSSTNRHPNEKAHEYQSTFIENWLRSL